MIKPIAFQCGGLVCGNHDERNAKTSEIDMIQNICEDLEIPYLADSAYSRICYETYGENRGTLVYLIHGFSSSRQRGGKVNALENLAYVLFTFAEARRLRIAPAITKIYVGSRYIPTP